MTLCNVSARPRSLPSDVARLLVAGGGVVSTREALRLGVTDDRLHRLHRADLLVRLARGTYADANAFDAADAWQRFALRSRAFTLSCGSDAVAAGWSAAAVLGLPAISPPPELPKVATAVGRPANSAFGLIRRTRLAPDEVQLFDGCRVTRLPRTLADIARTSPPPDALVAVDAGMRRTSGVAVRAAFDDQKRWPGSDAARWVLEHADPFAESPLETLGRLTFIEHHLPVPVSNVWVGHRPVCYRVDHLLDQYWVVFEGDGLLKFGGSDAARQVARMQEREWQLHEWGFAVARYGWGLARHDRARLAARFRAAINRAPSRDADYPWWRSG